MAALSSFSFLLCVLFVFSPNYVGSSSERAELFRSCSVKCDNLVDGAIEKGIVESNSQFNHEACERGCRFRAMLTLFKSNPNVPDPENDCASYCDEFYGEKTTQVMCHQGCGPEEEPEQEKKAGIQEEGGFSLDLSEPVLQVRKIMSKVIGSLQIVTTVVHTYFKQEDDTLVAVQSAPISVINTVDEETHEPAASSTFNRDFKAMLESAKREGKPELFERENLSPVFQNGLRQYEGRYEDIDRIEIEDTPEVQSISIMTSSYNYVHLAMMLMVVSFTLIGLSTCIRMARHHRRISLKAANLETAIQQEPLKLVRPEDLTKLSIMEEEDAIAAKKMELNFNHANV